MPFNALSRFFSPTRPRLISEQWRPVGGREEREHLTRPTSCLESVRGLTRIWGASRSGERHHPDDAERQTVNAGSWPRLSEHRKLAAALNVPASAATIRSRAVSQGPSSRQLRARCAGIGGTRPENHHIPATRTAAAYPSTA